MNRNTYILYFFLFLALPVRNLAQVHDSLSFQGQVSAWMLYNDNNGLPVYTGGRYIPQINYSLFLRNDHLIDFEASANINGNLGFNPFDTLKADGQIKSYRLWARYSTKQFEVRAGLQKINFGSASILRPLMWFDQVDPRDPLQLTDGVWGVLGRYYFLNNTNIWLWGLFGNKDPKGWELISTNTSYPEFGGRIQVPVPRGEAALSYHHRVADSGNMGESVPQYSEIQENRVGFDIKLDVTVGLWLEGSWVTKNKNIGAYTNQELLNIGSDYTFGIGNGLNLTFEQLFSSNGEEPFEFRNTTSFSLLSLSYPLGIFDNISGIVYYDWKNSKIYNFINWEKQFNNITMYIMGFLNPVDYIIPTQVSDQNLYAGKGIQIMLVFNH